MKWRIEYYLRRTKNFFLSFVGLKSEPVLVPNPLMKWPRNFSCVCGSGRKFKKCHLPDLAKNTTFKDAVQIESKLKKYRV